MLRAWSSQASEQEYCSEAASLCFHFAFLPSEMKSTSSEQISVTCAEGELYFPQGANCSNIMSEWYSTSVPWENKPESALKGLRSTCTIHCNVSVKGRWEAAHGWWWYLVLGDHFWSAGHAGGKPMTVLIQLDWEFYVTNMISARVWAWDSWKWDWQCPQPVFLTSICSSGGPSPHPSPSLNFFLIYSPLGGSCRSFWSTWHFSASVRKHSVYSCVGFL